MNEICNIPCNIQGFVKIIDKTTGELLVDTTNDVLYGNISSALAYSLIGNPDSFLAYMAFGNGGAYVGPTGIISYKPTLGGPSSLIKNPTANLYNTIYVKKLSNDSTDSSSYNQLSRAYIPSENLSTNYEDIIIDVTLGYSEPPASAASPTSVTQSLIDNSTFVGTPLSTDGISTANEMVFNEIGLFAGSTNLFDGQFTQTTTDVTNFINQGVNFSTQINAKSKLMITHVVFHPIQKAANRSLEILYTLRIQIGAM